MQKVLLGAALALAATGSWAFYPKAAQPTAGTHMMVIGNFTLSGFSADANVTTIGPDGHQTEQPVDIKIRSAEKVAAGFVDVQKVALFKINELSASGWHVVSATPNTYARGGTTFVSQTIYTLEKR
ncbi:MAG: hypothetical protein EOO62_14950 [Hymenobacter sp.]|nr:MAG: hypothetical protein EOO62_14950 [Hymenobacter sp.]